MKSGTIGEKKAGVPWRRVYRVTRKESVSPILFYVTVQNKVIRAETAQGTAQQHKHMMEDRVNPSAGHIHHEAMTQGTFNTLRHNDGSLYVTFTHR